jgi:hypothetical protein
MKTASSDFAHERCQYRTRTGRQCTSRVLDPQSSHCSRHAAAEPRDFEDFSAPLTGTSCRFLNAQGINYSLASLYHLLASGRISPRRASVLAYISNLLLRSLNAIDKDPCPDAGKHSDSENSLPNQAWQGDPWENSNLQRASYRQEENQILPRRKSWPQPNAQPQNSDAEISTPENAAPQLSTTPPATAPQITAQPVSAATPTPETMDTPNSHPPENDPQKTTPEKAKPASSAPPPPPPPNPPAIPFYGFTPNSVIGMRLAARNRFLPQHLRNPNDPAADFDRLTSRRKPSDST